MKSLVIGPNPFWGMLIINILIFNFNLILYPPSLLRGQTLSGRNNLSRSQQVWVPVYRGQGAT